MGEWPGDYERDEQHRHMHGRSRASNDPHHKARLGRNAMARRRIELIDMLISALGGADSDMAIQESGEGLR
jgi:hypothetical protein